MGFLSWLFPSTQDKIAKAQKLLEQERFAEARQLIVDLRAPEVPALMERCDRGLVSLNLERARGFCRAGNEGQVEHHLELAQRYAQSEQEAEFESFQRERIKIRRARNRASLMEQLGSAAKRRAELGPDPGDFSWIAFNGDGSIQLVSDEEHPLGIPRLVVQPDPAMFRPQEVQAAEEAESPSPEELERTRAALLEIYPSTLTEEVKAGGEPLLRALLFQVAGAPERAIPILLKLSDENPVGRLELARAACALGKHEAAYTLMEQFSEMVGGHRIGALHSIHFQAAIAAWSGDDRRALELLRGDLLAEAPHLQAALCIGEGALEEAREFLLKIYEESPKDARLEQLGVAWAMHQAAERLFEKHPELKLNQGIDPVLQESLAASLSEQFPLFFKEALNSLPMEIELEEPPEEESQEEEEPLKEEREEEPQEEEELQEEGSQEEVSQEEGAQEEEELQEPKKELEL